MERVGWIARTANLGMAQRTRDPTEQAMQILPQARRIIEQGNAMATGDLSKKEIATLIRLLGRYLKTAETKLR